MSGKLYVVATPIGNLLDITARAQKILSEVDLIAAEDTRHSGRLLSHLGISKTLISLHDYNEQQRLDYLIKELKANKQIALISDAGTPLISDPGYHLVNAVRNEGISVIPVPGCCAAITALSVSGLPTDRFIFEGFLPIKSAARLNQLKKLQDETRTIIFYEAPHRILATLHDIKTVFGGQRIAVLARELTKLFETIEQANIDDLIAWVTNDIQQQKGEMVLLIQGQTDSAKVEKTNELEVLRILLEELPVKQAVNLAAKITQTKKNHLYQLALEFKQDAD